MSGFDLNDFAGPWWEILQRHRLGERVDKQEIVDAIGSDYPIPDAAKPLIKAVLTKEYKFKTNKADRRFDGHLERNIAKGMVDRLEQLIRGDDDISDCAAVVRDARDEYKSGRFRRPSSLELAKEIVAGMYEISVRKLEGILSQD